MSKVRQILREEGLRSGRSVSGAALRLDGRGSDPFAVRGINVSGPMRSRSNVSDNSFGSNPHLSSRSMVADKPKPIQISLTQAETEVVQRLTTKLKEVRVEGQYVIDGIDVQPPANANERTWVFKVISNKEGLDEAFFRSKYADKQHVENETIAEAKRVIPQFSSQLPSIKQYRIELN